MSRYALIDGAGLVDNIIEWDGKTEWQSPEGLRPVKLADDSTVGPGDTVTSTGKLKMRDDRPPEPTVEDRLAALEHAVGVLPETTTQ